MLTVNKNEAITKLNRLIEDGRQNAAQVIDHVLTHQPQDFIVKASALRFSGDGGLRVALNNADFGVHRFALNQIAEIASVPTKFVDALSGDEWGRALIAHNLNEIFSHRDAKRHLVRTVNGNEVRGFLSDQYRRLDSRPIVEAFATGVQRLGALPYKGYVTDTKIAIQAIVPDVYEPIPGEIVAFVVSLENSDFGNGALSLRVGIVRIFCDNLAVFEENLRQIHLGRRLDENIKFSQRTYELDTKTTVSALDDIIGVQLNRQSIQRRMELVAANATKAVDATSAQKMLRDVLGVGEAQKVIDAYKSADIEMIPAGNNVWRLANAISWIGGQEPDDEKKLELMKLAGRVLLSSRKDSDSIPHAETEVAA